MSPLRGGLPYWLLAALFCAALAAALVSERSMPSPAGQPPDDDLPEEIGEARDLASGGDFIAARNVLHGVVEADPDLAVAHFILAEISMQVGDLRDAERRARTASALEPEEAQYRLFLSSLYSHVGWSDRAEAELNSLLDMEPGNLEGLLQRSHLHFVSGRHDKALEDLDFAVEATERDPDALFSRAQLKMFTKDFEGASADLAELEESEDGAVADEARAFRERYGL